MALVKGNRKSRYVNTYVVSDKEGMNKGLSRRLTKHYRSIPESDTDIYVITQHGDRLDLLANEYYGDPHLWWYIAKANNLKFNNLEPEVQLRIPSTLEYI